ncbi:hypothetical protein MO867_09370 [Microbulbifer sp. OS29]|uniref:Uncharacterized protein n=1 Tax=Microbulbifer okhotskensis TaxID=2926617 RepID=A0A9X2ELQ8_9GAMM|nr:hypothetical protein [Microbulbifer okhotskensis]MCO1334547.1 hypothetical protein [Microbulbifer okhotskensis]
MGFLKSIFITATGFLLAAFHLGVSAEPLLKVSKRPDGSALYWALEQPSTNGKYGLFLIAQGSGCLPAVKILPSNRQKSWRQDMLF